MAEKKAKKAAEKTEKKVKAKPATGFAPLKFKDYTITQKRSGRFQVKNTKGGQVNGDEKVKVLLEAKVLKGSFKKAGSEEAAAT